MSLLSQTDVRVTWGGQAFSQTTKNIEDMQCSHKQKKKKEKLFPLSNNNVCLLCLILMSVYFIFFLYSE